MSAQPDNALTALERARQAQERFERRIDVQLRIPAREWPYKDGFVPVVEFPRLPPKP